jgi:hypothetical protein
VWAPATQPRAIAGEPRAGAAGGRCCQLLLIANGLPAQMDGGATRIPDVRAPRPNAKWSGQPTSAVAAVAVVLVAFLAVAGGPWAAGRAWTTWLSGPASEGRRQQCTVHTGHRQCVRV